MSKKLPQTAETTDLGELFRRRLIITRKMLGVTQAELARRAKCSERYICDLESGRKLNPTLRTLGKFADALSVPAAYLITETRA